MDKPLACLCLLLLSLAMPGGARAGDPVAAVAGAAAPRVLVLVRHGHYAADPAVDERIGPGLSALGVAQARLVAARLAAQPGGLDGLHASPMQRARDTAAAIGESLPGQRFDVVDDLAECTPPTRRADVMAREEGTALAACQARLERMFERFFRPASGTARTDLLVCHGNVIRYLVTRALGVDTTAWLEMSVGHASITRIRVEADGTFKVIAVGDVGHLPPNLLTGASGDPERSLAAPVLP